MQRRFLFKKFTFCHHGFSFLFPLDVEYFFPSRWNYFISQRNCTYLCGERKTLGKTFSPLCALKAIYSKWKICHVEILRSSLVFIIKCMKYLWIMWYLVLCHVTPNAHSSKVMGMCNNWCSEADTLHYVEIFLASVSAQTTKQHNLHELAENNSKLSSLLLCVRWMSTTWKWIKIYLNVKHNVFSVWIIYEFVFYH